MHVNSYIKNNYKHQHVIKQLTLGTNFYPLSIMVSVNYNVR